MVREGLNRMENKCIEASGVVQWLRLQVSNAGAQVQSQVMELRSYMPSGADKKTKTKKLIPCLIAIKDLQLILKENRCIIKKITKLKFSIFFFFFDNPPARLTRKKNPTCKLLTSIMKRCHSYRFYKH